LHNEMVRVEFAPKEANFIGECTTTNSDMQNDYTNLHEALTTAADKVIPLVNTQSKHEWMNSEILDLMEQRRKCKRKTQQYKQLDRIIRSKCSEAKTNFYNAQCVQLEQS